MELINKSIFKHRQTFNVVNNTIINKVSFTTDDLWEFFQLCYHGRNDALGSKSEINKELIAQRKRSLIETFPKIQPNQVEIFNNLVIKYSLDAVLFGIEDYTEVYSVYDLDKLEIFTKKAEIFLNKKEING